MNYKRQVVKRSFFITLGLSIAVLALAGRVFADGAYLRTDDRKKTLVWNNDPKPGDAAEWNGKRDSEGYAEGPGTITWLRPQKQSLFSTGSNILGTKKVPLSRLTGTMVHGKFVGGVTTIDRGKTYHAKYVDGQRKGNWSLGPVIAKATSVETAEPEQPKKPSEPKIAAAEKVETSAGPKTSGEAEPEPPTEGPDEPKAAVRGERTLRREVPSTASAPREAGDSVSGETEVRSQKSAVSGSTAGAAQPKAPLIAQAEVDESTPRQQPVTRKAALAPGAVRAIEKPGTQVEKKVEKPKTAATKVKAAPKVETPKIEKPKAEPSIVEREVESPAEGPRSAAAKKAQTPNPKSQKEELSHPSAGASAKEEPSSLSLQPTEEESPADNSIRTLTGPPSSLRAKPAAAPPAVTTPEPAISIAPASSAAAEPKLNSVQAMDIADIEARTKGYDLGEYQLPKAEYNAADDTWAVSYIGRDKNAKGLHVTIQDKSGKAEVRK